MGFDIFFEKNCTTTEKSPVEPKTPQEDVFDSLGGQFVEKPLGPDIYIPVGRLPGFCPRKELIQYRKNVISKEPYGPGLRILMDQGKLLAHQYRNWYMGPRGAGVGSWKCLSCGKSTDDHHIFGKIDEELRVDGKLYGINGKLMFFEPKECPVCAAPRFFKEKISSGRIVDSDDSNIVFNEWLFKNEDLKVRGRPDFFVYDFTKKAVVIQELKSTSPSKYNKFVKETSSDHLIQVFAYMWMMGGKINGEIVYLNRSGHGDCIDKFWHTAPVKYNEEFVDRNIVKPVSEFRRHQEKGTLPRPICVSKNAPKAKACKFLKECFEKFTP
jgi:hypothetical protein